MHNLNTRSLRITRSHVWEESEREIIHPTLNMKQKFNDLPKATLVGTKSVLEPSPPDFANLVQHSFLQHLPFPVVVCDSLATSF